MSLFVYVLVLTTLAQVSCNSCDNLGVLLYEDLGCIPQYNETSYCPVKYNCEGLEEVSDFCYFRGRPYKNLEYIDEKLLDPSCDRACSCSIENGKSNFICAVLDCPEWLGYSVRRNCYRKYSLDECCSVGEVCPPFDSIEKCVVDGIVYKEGEQFYPKNSCYICVCQKGFEGKFEAPFCRKWSCGVQLKNAKELRNGCAPWYDKKEALCCPFKWICPDGSENIGGIPTSDDVCRYGEKTLKVGQGFERFNVQDDFGKVTEVVKCECIIPSLMTCIDE